MTTGLKTKASGNADLDLVFDPYVQGTSPPATGLNVGGTTTDINTRYAPIVFGSAAAATGFNTKQSGNADLNTLFAAYGTAVYALPINGKSYTAAAFTTGAGVNAALNFNAATSGWTVTKNIAGTVTTLDSGTIPAGATKVKYTDTWLNATGDTGTGSPTNGAPSFTTLTSTSISASDSIGVAGGGGTKQTTHSMNIQFQNAAGATISNTTITFVCIADGE